MIRALSGTTPPTPLAQTPSATWIDLDRPTDAEHAQARQATSLPIPTLHQIAEIETSSRLVNTHGTLTLSTPMVSRAPDGTLAATPIGFVLTADRLITIRFAASTVFDHFAETWRLEPGTRPDGMQPFLGLLEAITDRLADVLEQLSAEMDTLSADVFQRCATSTGSSRRRDAFLQATLAEIGRTGARTSQLRDGLLGIARIARYVPEAASSWLEQSERSRLVTIERDIVSLTEFSAQLTNKVQFLLDATLGFIGIEQNDTIKVLTVVSIVGIPPTFIASLYGMNFKNMPELSWTYGYPYALALIALSIVIPLMLFWRRGWL